MWVIAVAVLLTDVGAPRHTQALGSAFTYQGQLRQGGSPANGSCDLQFGLFDAPSQGMQIGATQMAEGVDVRNGVFTVQLDFGSAAFSGSDRWLEIGVRCPTGSGNFVVLNPRQPLTPAPYAISAPLVARDAQGNTRVEADVTNDHGFLILSGANGSRNVLLSTIGGFPNAGSVGVYDAQDEERAVMTVGTDSGAGFIGTTGPNGDRNVLIGTLNNYPDNGYVGVADANSNFKAAIFVNADGKGELFADVKNFVVDHPNRPDTKIMYVSLEGPEAAIYDRGVVQLRNGRATIELPEHFVALANVDTITVQLTPRSFDSEGLAFGAIHDGRIEVRELHKGKGSYDVHFVVHAVRRGYEDRHPVMASDEFRARFGPQSPSGAAASRKSGTAPQAPRTLD